MCCMERLFFRVLQAIRGAFILTQCRQTRKGFLCYYLVRARALGDRDVFIKNAIRSQQEENENNHPETP